MRIRKLKKIMRKKLIDVLVVISNEQFVDPTLSYFLEEEQKDGVLLIFKDKKPNFYVSNLHELKQNKNVNVLKYNSNYDILKELKDYKNIAINLSLLSVNFVQKFKEQNKGNGKKYIDYTKIVKEMREIKDNLEIQNIKKAIRITEKIFSELFKELQRNKFRSEYEIYSYLNKSAIDHGVKTSFNPVVASGANSANPHYYPKKNSKLNKGFCVIDFGVEYNGYCADITRTVFVGNPTKEDINNYKKVLDGIYWCEKNITKGSNCKKIFQKFNNENFAMIHALGHGIGLNIHESPNIALDNIEFKQNQCLAIEPAIYVKNKFGIRIEDDYVVGEKNIIKISSMSRKLRVFK